LNIVIFGCDNSGKTTLAKTIDSFIGGYIHSPGPLKDVEQQKKFIDNNIDLNTVNIFDRFPIIEESVCGEVLRNHNNFENEKEYVNNILDKIDLFIYCFPGINSITGWGDREQMTGIKENVMDLVSGYDKFYNFLKDTGRPVVLYDYNKSGSLIKFDEVDN